MLPGMTQKQLERLCREWQKTLRLQDWWIVARLVGQADMIPPDALASCTPTITQRKAVILVLHPSEWRIASEWPRDIEQTLCHELLHLHFAPFAPDDWNTPVGIAMEQAIDLIAEALVAAKRSAPLRTRKLSKKSTKRG